MIFETGKVWLHSTWNTLYSSTPNLDTNMLQLTLYKNYQLMFVNKMPIVQKQDKCSKTFFVATITYN